VNRGLIAIWGPQEGIRVPSRCPLVHVVGNLLL
jgi:hypothetical protein